MGQTMCAHVLSAGYALTIFNRTPSKAQTMCDKGALMVDFLKLVATQSDVVFIIMGYPTDIHQLIMGENVILEGLNLRGIIIDMTISKPSLMHKIFTTAKERGIESIDTLVSSRDKGAKARMLVIFVGGEENVMEKLRPLFNCMGKVIYMGGPGLGQYTKLGNQITIASMMVDLIEGMVYAYKAGLNVPM